MTIGTIIEAIAGLAAIVLAASACWHEDQLIAWEDKHLLPLFRRICQTIRHKPAERGAER